MIWTFYCRKCAQVEIRLEIRVHWVHGVIDFELSINHTHSSSCYPGAMDHH